MKKLDCGSGEFLVGDISGNGYYQITQYQRPIDAQLAWCESKGKARCVATKEKAERLINKWVKEDANDRR